MTEYYTQLAEETLKLFETDPESGLMQKLHDKRKKRYRPNLLREVQKISRLIILTDQFKSIVILVLLAAAIIAFSLQHTAVLLINTLIGFYTYLKRFEPCSHSVKFIKIRYGFDVIQLKRKQIPKPSFPVISSFLEAEILFLLM